MRTYDFAKLYLLAFFVFLTALMLLHDPSWKWISTVYILIAVFYLVYRFCAWFFADISKKKSYGLSDEPYTVLIPVKDEDSKVFIRCVKSVVDQEGTKEILIGDDGSKKPMIKELLKHPELRAQVRIARMDKNIGKKHMQGLLMHYSNYDIIVNIDSDVILSEKTTILKLIAPFKDKKVGLSNGNVKLLSPTKSVLNRVQSFMYFCANQIGRKSWGNLGLNPVASGELLAIRRSYFEPFMKEYMEKKFLGKRINFGEDRLMTNLLLRAGYKSVYVEDTVAYSPAIETLPRYLKQQTRWRRSGIRESLFTLGFSKNPNLLFMIGARLILPIFFTILLFSIIAYDILTMNAWHVFFVLAVLIFVTLIADLPMVLENPRRLPDLVLFSLFNMIFLTPLWVYALFTLDETGWGTR